MAIYKDFSNYQIDNKIKKDIINIGWLGGIGNFPQGRVSEAFLMNLWEYYKSPIYPTRKIYQNEELDGKGKIFTAICKGRKAQLGSSEIRVLNKEKGVIYASPSLIIHYIINHNYLPPDEYMDAVIGGPKPNSNEYCEMIRYVYKDIKKREGQNGVCPFCYSKCGSFAYREIKNRSKETEVIVVESSKCKEEQRRVTDYTYYLLCEDCGHLYEYDLASLM